MKKSLFPLLGVVLFAVLAAGLCFSSCASKPAPSPEPALPPGSPVLSLTFDHIEAESPTDIILAFMVHTENPRSEAMDINLAEWELLLNDVRIEKGADLSMEGGTLAAHSAGNFPARIKLSGEALAPADHDNPKEYRAGISLNLGLNFHDGENSREVLSAQLSFPRIRPPEFSIASLAVIQAELINTRFRVTLRIDNPNNFPLELSAFNYELYGAGRYWADGKETKVMEIPPGSSTEKDLFLLMNFMNMKREVLDQVIALKTVRYRFSGDVMVDTGMEYLPQFKLHFDRTGDSPVVQ